VKLEPMRLLERAISFVGTNLLKFKDNFAIAEGAFAALPTCNEDWRGAQARMPGGTGVADVYYRCTKNDSDAYEWVEVGAGGGGFGPEEDELTGDLPILTLLSESDTDTDYGLQQFRRASAAGTGIDHADDTNVGFTEYQVRTDGGVWHTIAREWIHSHAHAEAEESIPGGWEIGVHGGAAEPYAAFSRIAVDGIGPVGATIESEFDVAIESNGGEVGLSGASFDVFGGSFGVFGSNGNVDIISPTPRISTNDATTFATLAADALSADRTFAFPDESGTLMLTSAIGSTVQAFDADLTTLSTAFTTASGAGAASLAFAEDTDNGSNRVLLQGPASTADVTQTLQAVAGTIALTADIPSQATIEEYARDAVGTALVAGTGLDKTIDDGGDTITLDIDSTVVTLTGSQILTNKTLTAPTIADFTNMAHDHGDADDGGSLAANITLTTPTIASFTNATHNHTNAAGGGQITDAALSAAVGIAKGGTGSVLADPGADRLLFWDESGNVVDWLTPDATDLAISGTTLALGSAPSFSDFTNAQHDHGDADDGGTLTLAAIPSITASAAELNILDGATLTVTELNYVDGVTSGIQAQIDALGGGELWTPAAYTEGTHLVRWFDASQNDVLTDNTQVDYWVDSSPNGVDIDAFGHSGADKPSIQTNEANGLPAMQFSGNQFFETDPAFPVAGDQFTFIYVVKSSSATGTDDFWTSRDPNDTAFAGRFGGFERHCITHFEGASEHSLCYQDDDDTAAFHIHAEVFNRAASFASYDGDATANTYTSGSTLANASIESGFSIGWDIGAGGGPVVANSFSGLMPEFAVLGYAASAEEVERWEGYLADKYAITLASGHPYENAPPRYHPHTLSDIASVTATVHELNYTQGVTSAIQTQLDAKQPLDADLTDIAAIADVSGDIIIRGAAGWERLAKGTDGEVLKLVSGLPSWETDETTGGAVDTANSPNAGEYARFTDADTIEGRTEAEFKADFNLEIGTDVQAYSADLDSLVTAWVPASAAGAATLDFHEDTDNGTNRVRLAGAASTADVTVTLPATTGTVALTSDITLATLGVDADLATFSVPASTTISAFGATLVDDANAAAVLATLVLDADLATFALPASTTITAAGATLVGLADPNADRLALWDDSASSYALAAVGTGLSISATPTLDLDADLVTLSTAFTTASASGAASLAFHEDTDNGTNRVLLQGPASTADVTVTLPDSTGTLYVSGGTDVAIADGGTGQSTATAGFDALAPTTTQGDIIYYNGTDNVRLGPGTSGQKLTTGGAGANPAWASGTHAVNITIGDGSNEIPDGVWCDFDMPVAGTFIRWRLMATKFTSGSTGSIVVDIWGEDFASFPPTVADSISTSKPTISGAASAEDSSITDWTPETFAAGDTFRINVDSCTTISLCTLSLWFTVP
jgi:hypothetical protein